MAHITGTTKLAGVIGAPLHHTLSPVMHNAVYQHLGLDWAYVPLAVEDEIGFRRVIAAVRSLPFVGLNVTMPFKQAALEACDEVAMTARMAGAVNTIHCVDGRLVGYNTDGRGLVESLESDAGFTLQGKRVVLLGAGGAAGSAFVSFILSKVTDIAVVNRDSERASELIARMVPHMNDIAARALIPAEAEEAVARADLIVNATPVGMRPGDDSPVPVEWLRQGQVVCDMIYGTASPTVLIAGARAIGATALDGVGMLVCQGATAVDIWNDSKQTRTPREVMRAAAEAELAARMSVVSL